MIIEAPALEPAVDLDSVDLTDPCLFQTQNVHGIWHALRRKAPVSWHRTADGTGFWSVTRYDDCGKVLRDHETYSSEHGTILASVGVGDSAGGSTITLADPPGHTALRAPAARLFNRPAVQARADAIQEQVARLVGPLIRDGGGDFAQAMRRLPMAVFGDVMGVPEPLRDEIAQWAMVSVAPEDPEFHGSDTAEDAMRDAHHELFALYAEALRYARRHPGNDLLTVLTELRVDGRPLGERGILLNCYSYTLGAHSTTPHVAAQTLLALSQHPQLRDEVRSQPDALPGLIEEGVRWTTPTHHLVRQVAKSSMLGGVALAEGDWVCAWVASANRDEQIFEEPYAFQPGRRPNPHLGFGSGPHFCIGTHLARAALTALFDILLHGSIDVTPAGEPVHLRSNWINGLTQLPVVVRGLAA